MSKIGVISLQLNYEFDVEKSNEEIKDFLFEVELPHGYKADTYEYVGIWNRDTDEWEEN
jgi:hypothetical protein